MWIVLPVCDLLNVIIIMIHARGDFTFWINLSLRPSLSPKYRLRPKIREKWSRFFLFGLKRSLIECWDQTLDSVIVETKVNPNLPHYSILVLHGRDTLIL